LLMNMVFDTILVFSIKRLTMIKKKAGPIGKRVSVSKRALPDEKTVNVISPKRGEPFDRSKFKSSAAKFITENINPVSEFPVIGIGASAGGLEQARGFRMKSKKQDQAPAQLIAGIRKVFH